MHRVEIQPGQQLGLHGQANSSPNVSYINLADSSDDDEAAAPTSNLQHVYDVGAMPMLGQRKRKAADMVTAISGAQWFEATIGGAQLQAAGAPLAVAPAAAEASGSGRRRPSHCLPAAAVSASAVASAEPVSGTGRQSVEGALAAAAKGKPEEAAKLLSRCKVDGGFPGAIGYGWGGDCGY